MFSLFIRNFVFTVLQPGVVAGLIPWLILGDKVNSISKPIQWYQYFGFIIVAVGFIVMINCIISFAIKGKGTLSPADPTKKLVVTGLYNYSRNPMYVGVILILIGEALFFQSTKLLLYSILIYTAFYFFIILFEEPRLRKDFGQEYINYCKKVRRFI